MPWQKHSCSLTNSKGHTIKVSFFKNLEKFGEKLQKHILSPAERMYWQKFIPEIIRQYSNKKEFTADELAYIYQEMIPFVEKAWQFIWQFPLHVHYERQVGNQGRWRKCFLGVSPEGLIWVFQENVLLTSYAMVASKHTGNFQCFFAALRQGHRKASRKQYCSDKGSVQQRKQHWCTLSAWRLPFQHKNLFESFFSEYQEITPVPNLLSTKIHKLLAKYRSMRYE